MPRTRECDFCGSDVEPGTGTMLVKNDGSTVIFCSSKCEKNADLGREPRDAEWTAEGRDTGGAAEPEQEDETTEPATDEPEADEEAEDESDEAPEDESDAAAEADDTEADAEDVEDEESEDAAEEEAEA